MSISKTVIAVIFALAAVFSIVFLTVSSLNTQDGAVSDGPKQINGYLVKEYEGKIAVFEQHGTDPVFVLDNPRIRDLPAYDRALLAVGIPVKNTEELGSLIEDYDS